MTLKDGSIAPNFDLPNDEGKNISLSSLKGKNVVLYFYPKDDTPGCTQEGKDFSENHDKFKAANTEVFGVSKDSVKSHDKFKCKYEFSFSLLSDEEGKTCGDYDVWKEKSMYGKKFMGIERSTFLIDKNGHIAKIWRGVSVPGHILEVLSEAEKLA